MFYFFSVSKFSHVRPFARVTGTGIAKKSSENKRFIRAPPSWREPFFTRTRVNEARTFVSKKPIPRNDKSAGKRSGVLRSGCIVRSIVSLRCATIGFFFFSLFCFFVCLLATVLAVSAIWVHSMNVRFSPSFLLTTTTTTVLLDGRNFSRPTWRDSLQLSPFGRRGRGRKRPYANRFSTGIGYAGINALKMKK